MGVRFDGRKTLRKLKPGQVSILPTTNDIWDLEIKIGMALARGRFDNARFLRDQLAAIKTLEFVEAATPRRFSAVDLKALDVARAWVAGQGDNARYLAEQLNRIAAAAERSGRK